MTRAQREAAHVAGYLARRGLVEAPQHSYGRGERWIHVPVPADAQNGRKRVTLLVRRTS